MPKSKLEDLQIEELQKRKLIREIKINSCWFKALMIISPLLTALATLFILYKLNIFEANSKFLEAKKEILNMDIHDFKLQKDSLHKQVLSLQSHIISQEQTIKNQRHKIVSQIRDNKILLSKKDSLLLQVEQQKISLEATNEAVNHLKERYATMKDGEISVIGLQKDTIRTFRFQQDGLLKYLDKVDSVLSGCIVRYKLPINYKEIEAQRPTIYVK